MTWRRAADYLGGTIEVVAHCELGAGPRFEFRHGGKRHHFSPAVAHIELADVLRPGPVIAFRLDIDLPLAPETVEVVHEQPAHESLDSAIDIVEGHTLLDYFVAVDIDELLRHARQESAHQAPDFRAFPGCAHERG